MTASLPYKDIVYVSPQYSVLNRKVLNVKMCLVFGHHFGSQFAKRLSPPPHPPSVTFTESFNPPQSVV